MHSFKHDLLTALVMISLAIASFITYKLIGKPAIVLFIVFALLTEIIGGILK